MAMFGKSGTWMRLYTVPKAVDSVYPVLCPAILRTEKEP